MNKKDFKTSEWLEAEMFADLFLGKKIFSKDIKIKFKKENEHIKSDNTIEKYLREIKNTLIDKCACEYKQYNDYTENAIIHRRNHNTLINKKNKQKFDSLVKKNSIWNKLDVFQEELIYWIPIMFRDETKEFIENKFSEVINCQLEIKEEFLLKYNEIWDVDYSIYWKIYNIKYRTVKILNEKEKVISNLTVSERDNFIEELLISNNIIKDLNDLHQYIENL